MNEGKLRILIVDDDKLYRLTLSNLLKIYGVLTESDSKENALSVLAESNFDIAFIDLKMREEFEGLDVVKKCAAKGIYSVVLSSYTDEDIVEKAYENGCNDYFEKGNEEKSIKEVIDKFFLTKKKSEFQDFIQNEFITQDPSTIEELEFVFKNSTGTIPIFISGSTGVGKTKLAAFIHRFSKRIGKYVEINCSQINSNLIESELFGHKKGSFTNAISDKDGLIKSADGGTLFLDEICSIPLEVQTKLLKVIEEKTFYPVGNDKLQFSNFRIICASQHNIVEKIQKGEFRSDLFYRISGINIRLKPLSERREDVPLIIKKHLKGNRKIVIKEDAMDLLKHYNWPGNVRELLKVVEILSIKDKGIIAPSDLPAYITENTVSPHESAHVTDYQYEYAMKHGLKKFIKDIEMDLIQRTLKNNREGVILTLKDLRISRTKFYTFNEIMKGTAEDESGLQQFENQVS